MSRAANAFRERAAAALGDSRLQAVLRKIDAKFIGARRRALEALPEYPALRDHAAGIRAHVLDHLDLYLERFMERVAAAGGEVHLAADAAAARRLIVDICHRAGVRTVTKSKSMIGEEVGINAALEAAGITPVETDLGEYILQLAGETPSHIIAPAFHKTKEQVADLFARFHDASPPRDRGADLVAEARSVLRERYFAADAGLTGANFLIAETGQTVLVTNEGNGDLCHSLPRLHIVLASIEKLVPTLEDATTLLRLLARSATGQDITAYTSFILGPRRAGDATGPTAFHVVLIDNGRTAMLADPDLRPLLRCIRCGACINHCPVYGSIGGHAYGWVYPGPIGAALDPALAGLSRMQALPEASTLCGACAEVCPVKIPLPDILRHWREESHAAHLDRPCERVGVRLWAWLARHPGLYHPALRLLATLLRRMAQKGSIRSLPFLQGWTRTRDLPAPEALARRHGESGR
ncbi:MAG: lactate utilization protein B [Rhodothalassiaceae bacterium]